MKMGAEYLELGINLNKVEKKNFNTSKMYAKLNSTSKNNPGV